MEAEIINRLRAVVEESRRQYDRQADGAVRDTVGRDDVTTTTLGEMVAIPPPPRMEPTRPSSPAPMAVSTDGGPATAQQPDAAPQPPPSTSDIATPSQAAADNVSPEEMPQVISPQGPAESPAPQVASAGSPAQGQINPLAWMIGDRHLAAWFPLTDAGHSHGGLVTGVLLAIAADGALNYLGTQQRTAAMHNMPPSPAVLAGIFPQPPGRNPPPPPAPPNVPPAPGGPTPPTDGRGPTSPNAPTAPPGAAPVANPGNPAAPVQTVTAVPEAVAVHSPSVNVMLNQVGTQVRQATRAGVANAQTQSPKDLTQSVNDWVKSVQKGVQLRLGKEANSAGKTGDSFRAIKTNGAGSNLITQAINTATHGVGESIGEGAATDEKNLD